MTHRTPDPGPPEGGEPFENRPPRNRFTHRIRETAGGVFSVHRRTFLLALPLLLLVSAALRVLLLSEIHWPRNAVWAVLWGLLADVPLACAASVVLAKLSRARGWSAFLCLPGCTLLLFLMGFWTALQFFYFQEFHARLDQIFVDYVVYTAEVTGTVWEDYPVVPVLATLWVLSVIATVFLRRCGAVPPGRRSLPENPGRKGRRFTSAVGACALFSLAGFVTLRVFPGESKTLSEVADNGVVRLVRAVRTGTLDFYNYYAHLPDPIALEEARRHLASDPQFVRFLDHGLRHLRSPSGSGDPAGVLNAVIVIAESLGTEFVGGLSPEGCRLPLAPDAGPTPRLHAYLEKGTVFPATYATGTRTARGMEAILCSLPPVPGPAVFKRNKIGPVGSIASVLSARGYETLFLYGGGLDFDNMNDFLPKIGFSRTIGIKQLEATLDRSAFRTSWGYADEFVFDHALCEMVRLRKEGKPFLMTILTLSNHSPYTFPDGRVRFPNGTRVGALAYADYALGRFLDQAAAAGFFQDTLFTVVGDHGPRAYLSEQLPLEAHRVVFALWGAGVSEPVGRCDLRRVSSMDVAPTVLGILGGRYESAFFGRDVLAGSPATYVFVQDKRDVGFVTGDRLALIGFRGKTAVATLDAADNPHDVETVGTEHALVRQGTALLQAAYGLHKGKW